MNPTAFALSWPLIGQDNMPYAVVIHTSIGSTSPLLRNLLMLLQSPQTIITHFIDIHANPTTPISSMTRAGSGSANSKLCSPVNKTEPAFVPAPRPCPIKLIRSRTVDSPKIIVATREEKSSDSEALTKRSWVATTASLRTESVKNKATTATAVFSKEETAARADRADTRSTTICTANRTPKKVIEARDPLKSVEMQIEKNV